MLAESLLVLHVYANKLYITSDIDQSTNKSNTITLSECLSNSKKYFTSNTELLFITTFYGLEEDFVLQNVTNISLLGNHSTIKCTNPSFGITIKNVTNIVVQNLEIVNCNRSYSIATFIKDNKPNLDCSAAVHILYCASVIITNVSITVTTGASGVVIFNTLMRSEINNLCVSVAPLNSINNYTTTTTNGIVAFFQPLYQSTSNNFRVAWLCIRNFTYRKIACFATGIHNALYIVINDIVGIQVKVLNTVLKDLCNTRVLYFYCSSFMPTKSRLSSKVDFINCKIQNNTGNLDINLLMVLFCDGSFRVYNSIFYNNTNITSIISVKKLFSFFSGHTSKFIILRCKFTHNHALNIIENGIEIDRYWHYWSTINMAIIKTTISSNAQSNGISLLSLDNAIIRFQNNTITNNSYYQSLIQLNLSSMRFSGYLRIFKTMQEIYSF